jgi:tetratricopeptide (TPR) repeat protein
MKGKSKTAVYFTAVVWTAFFAFFYFRQHSAVAHASPQASKPLMLMYLVLLLLSVFVLGLLGVLDLKTFLSGRVEQWMVQGSTPTQPVPELEEAQRVRTSGDPLEAIRLLREYLQVHPYELHVMSRIAEIYRYDLGNYLAAALEYEELLKRKLPDDQWSWAALHLAKIYGELNELEKSVTLLERLDSKYGHTIAGRRAKKALQAIHDPENKSSEDNDSEQEGTSG